MFDNIEFEVFSGLYQQYFNFLIENNYSLKNIQSTNFGFIATCSADEYIKFARHAKMYQCKIKVIKKQGLYFKLKILKRRKSILYGCILSVIMMYSFNNIIWKININTDDNIVKNNIATILYENGVYAGTFSTKNKLKYAESVLIGKDENIGFVTLNFYRGVLNCEIYKSIKKENYSTNNGTGDIIAKIGGVIKDLRVYDGYSELKLNQPVSKGDLLVMALNPITLKYTPTNAYIVAMCNKDYSVSLPFERTRSVYTGKIKKEKYIQFLDFTLKFKRNNIEKFEDWKEYTSIEYCNIFGFHLPFTIKTVTYCEIAEKTITSDIFELQNFAKNLLERQIMSDGKLVEEYAREYLYDISPDYLKVTCRMSCLYDIT